LAAIALILASVGLCSFGALGNGFAYDDHDLITGNDFLKAWMAGAPDAQGRAVGHVGEMLKADFAELAKRFGTGRQDAPLNYYRPVIAASYIIDTGFFAEIPPWKGGTLEERAALSWSRINPVGFHFTNLLFHALNSVLVYRLGLGLLRRYWAALAAAVLFAVHPMHTESVTWIAGRTDVIATTFFLGAFWGYVRFRRRGSRFALAAALVLFLVGTFAKEMVATLPIVLALYEVMLWLDARREDGSGSREDLGLRLIPALAFLIAIVPYFLVKAFFAAQSTPAPLRAPEADPWYGVSFSTVVTSLPAAVNWYFGKLLAPVSFNLYPMLAFVPPGFVGRWLPWFLLHAAVVAAAIWTLFAGKGVRAPAFLVLSLYATLAPLSCIIPGLRLARFTVDIEFPVSERFLYIPSLFLVLAIAWAGERLVRPRGRGWRVTALALLAAAGLGSAWITHGRNRDWRWNLSIFGATVKASPESIRMRINYAAALTADVWEVKEGRLHLERAHRIVVEKKPRFVPPEIYNNLARCNFLRRELHAAAQDRHHAWVLSGADPEGGNNLAVTLSVYGTITGDARLLQQAIGVFQRVLAAAPRHEMARQSIGFSRHVLAVWNGYFATGQRDDDLVERFARTYDVMSGSLEEDKDPERRFQALLILDAGLSRLPSPEELAGRPKSLEVRKLLIQRTERLQPRQARRLERLLQRHPGRAALRFLLAEVDRIGGRWLEQPELTERAHRRYESVLQAEPEHAQACLGLMSVLVDSEGNKGAVEALAVARRTISALLDESRVWEGRPLAPWPEKAVEVAERAARGPVAPAEGERIVRETWPRVLEVAEREARTREGGRSWKAWNGLGLLAARAADRLGRKELLDRAVQHVEKALALSPDSDPALANLIVLLERVGRHGDARQMKQRLERLRRRGRPPERSFDSVHR